MGDNSTEQQLLKVRNTAIKAKFNNLTKLTTKLLWNKPTEATQERKES